MKALPLDQLAYEHELAPAAATASDVAEHYDRLAAELLASGDPAVLAWALAHMDDTRHVRQARAPHDTVEGGYGRSFGTLTVGHKARWLLERLLPRQAAEAAIAEGPVWLEREKGRLRWLEGPGRFGLA